MYDLYSKEIVKFFNEEFKTNLKFVKLSSPREYNFYTDKKEKGIYFYSEKALTRLLTQFENKIP